MDFLKNLRNYLEKDPNLVEGRLLFLICLIFSSLALSMSCRLTSWTCCQPYRLQNSWILRLWVVFQLSLYPFPWICSCSWVFSRSFENIIQRNKYINKMNILEFEEENEEDLGEEQSHHFSIEEQTEELINQVFNQKYQPVFNPSNTKKKEQIYKKQKKFTNYYHKFKEPHRVKSNIKIYQNVQEEQASPSFKEFLTRAQGRIDKHNHWLKQQRVKKEQQQIKSLKQIPDILRGSREKVLPIYERCINLQKSKQKQLEKKRIQRYKQQVDKAESFTYHPSINGPRQKMRTFQQYFAQKQIWKQEKWQQLQKRRVALQVKKLSQCTFTPILVSKYTKPNPRIIPGEKVEQRLLRSMQRSLSKGKQNQ